MGMSRKANDSMGEDQNDLYAGTVSENVEDFLSKGFDDDHLKLDFDSDNLMGNGNDIQDAIALEHSQDTAANGAPHDWQDFQSSDWQDEPGLWDDDDPFG